MASTIDPTTGLPITNPSQAIPTSALSTPQTQIPIVSPADTTPLLTSAINTAAGVTQQGMEVAAQEQAAQQARDKQMAESNTIADLTRMTGNKSSDLAQAYQTGGVNDLYKQLSGYNTQAQGLVREATAIPLQTGAAYQGSSGTQAGVASVNRDLLQRNALQSLTLAQSAAIAQGNYDVAKNLADQQVNAKYAQIDAEIAARKINEEALYKNVTDPAIKKALEARMAQTKREEQMQADKKASELAVSKLLVDASQVAPKDVLDKAKEIQSKGGSATEVAMALGQYGGDYLANEKLKLEMKKVQQSMATENLQQQKLRGEITAQGVANSQAQIPEVAGWVANINSGKAKLSDVPQKLKNAVSLGLSTSTTGGNPAKLEDYKNKLSLVNNVLNSSALSAVVGPSPLGRIGYGLNRATGDMQEFTANVDQLTQGMTLQNLIDSKAKGATFGALSEKELELLAKSATRLNSYRKVDSNGNIYYDANESGFKSAINEIKDYTQKAFEREGGSNFVTTGNSVADQFVKSSMAAFNNANTSTPAMQAGYVDNQK